MTKINSFYALLDQNPQGSIDTITYRKHQNQHGSNYFLLPMSQPKEVFQLGSKSFRVGESHASFYEYLEGVGRFSRMHSTFHLYENDGNTRLQVHVYLGENNHPIGNPSVSSEQSEDVLWIETLEEDDFSLLNTLALSQTSVITQQLEVQLRNYALALGQQYKHTQSQLEHSLYEDSPQIDENLALLERIIRQIEDLAMVDKHAHRDALRRYKRYQIGLIRAKEILELPVPQEIPENTAELAPTPPLQAVTESALSVNPIIREQFIEEQNHFFQELLEKYKNIQLLQARGKNAFPDLDSWVINLLTIHQDIQSFHIFMEPMLFDEQQSWPHEALKIATIGFENLQRISNEACSEVLQRTLLMGNYKLAHSLKEFVRYLPHSFLTLLIKLNNNTCLAWILDSGQLEVNTILITLGEGQPALPLLWAAYQQHNIEGFKLLLNHGANILALGQDGLPLAHTLLWEYKICNDTSREPFFNALADLNDYYTVNFFRHLISSVNLKLNQSHLNQNEIRQLTQAKEYYQSLVSNAGRNRLEAQRLQLTHNHASLIQQEMRTDTISWLQTEEYKFRAARLCKSIRDLMDGSQRQRGIFISTDRRELFQRFQHIKNEGDVTAIMESLTLETMSKILNSYQKQVDILLEGQAIAYKTGKKAAKKRKALRKELAQSMTTTTILENQHNPNEEFSSQLEQAAQSLQKFIEITDAKKKQTERVMRLLTDEDLEEDPEKKADVMQSLTELSLFYKGLNRATAEFNFPEAKQTLEHK